MKLLPPEYQEDYLSPCYGQLRGALWALDLADVKGFCSRITPDDRKLDNCPIHHKAWLAGFYFNSALDRIAFVTDRLLGLFCYLNLEPELPPNKSAENTNINKLCCEANKKLKEPKLKDCDSVKAILGALTSANLKKTGVEPSNYLSIIRKRVNIQKHAFEGFPYNRSKSSPAGTWASLQERDWMKWARDATKVLADIYHELHRLYFIEDPPVLYAPKNFK